MQETKQLSNTTNNITLSVLSEESNTSTVLIGTYIKTLKKDFSNGYTVYYMSCKGFDDFKTDGKILCKGYLPITTHGVPLKLTGCFKKDYNDRYFFATTEVSLYSNKKEVTIEYILNIKIKGIGPKTAEKIVDVTGPDIFSYIKNEDALEKFNEILPNFLEDKIKKLFEIINETHFEKQIFEYIQDFGGTYLQAQNLFEQYHSQAISKIKTLPYSVGRNTDIPFVVCDAIARKENISPYNQDRIKYLVISALYHICNNGHTTTVLADIYNEVKYLINTSAFPDVIIPCTVIMTALHNSQSIIVEYDDENTPLYSLKKINDAEEVIAKNITKIINTSQNNSINIPLETKLTEQKLKISYSDKQKQAFEFLLSSGIKILTGGPGTGKSTVINGLIDIYKRYKPSAKIVLCAPTGRASQKMKEITKHKATTIHRLLNIQPYKTETEDIDYDNIDRIDADLIIIDEVSMVDTQLFAYITSAIPTNAITIFCGDTFQLPSVGPGNILQDLIALNLFEIVMLDIIHRQKEGSDIVALSQSIKNGDISAFIQPHKPVLLKNSKKSLYSNKEVQIIETPSSKSISDTIISALKNKFFNQETKHYIKDILDLQILSPTRKHEAGIIALNKEIKDAYHETTDNEYLTFAIGDKIMMTENNYNIGYYNGDVGFIKEFNAEQNSVIVEIDDNEYEIPHSNIKDISLAYACTIHKSQGSEYQYVIIALPKEPVSILQRNLIYTAVTRAKKYVAIICEENALEIAVSRNKSNKRKTNLKKKILSKI
jgi:exodeoxyribonuclease V alpha subunit